MSDFKIAAVLGKFPKKHPQQGSFSYAVGTEYADSLAPLDVQIYASKQLPALRASAKALFQVFRYNYVAAGGKIFFEMYFHFSHFAFRALNSFEHIKAFFTGSRPLRQMFGSVLLHFPDDFFLPCDFPLLVVVGPKLRFSADFFLRRIVAVLPLIGIDPVVFHFENSVYRSVKKVSVVGDYHDRPPIGFQVLFQPFQCADVQVIGRLVQKQDVRFFQQKRREGKPRSFPAGKGRNLLVVEALIKSHGI